MNNNGGNNSVKIIVGGNVYGPVTGENNGIIDSYTQMENGSKELECLKEEIDTAKKIISALNDITEYQKALLSELLDNTNQAIESGSSEMIKNNKREFSKTIKTMGNIGTKVISALSGVANLLKFFGFSLV